MENLNSINLVVRQRELAESLSDKYRRVWLQKTKFNSVCITVFPLEINKSYQMYFAKGVQDFSVENLRNIVLSNIEK